MGALTIGSAKFDDVPDEKLQRVQTDLEDAVEAGGAFVTIGSGARGWCRVWISESVPMMIEYSSEPLHGSGPGERWINI